MPAESLWIWRREPDGRQGICTDREHADRLRDYMDFEVIEVVPAEQLRGAVDLVRALGSAWRANDDEAISNALVRLEDAFGLCEQGAA